MKIKISDMLDTTDGFDLELPEEGMVSAEKIKEVTMKKIHDTQGAARRGRRISKAGVAAIVAAAVLALSGAAYAVSQWTGFASTEGLTNRQIQALINSASQTSYQSEDRDGNVTYYDENGNEEFTLTAEEAVAYEQAMIEAKEQAVRDSTTLVDVDTMDMVPTGITELAVNEDGSFEDFIVSNGHMVIFYPEGNQGYDLKAGDTVTLTLPTDEVCYMAYGMTQDGVATECAVVQTAEQSYTFEIPEDGSYCFYIIYYSAGANSFTGGSITVN
ncbi:MAG: hypothetical protein LJU34_10340 [Oscillospiraceae bacterium]|nr:hypothetical protein [Oscillospiraceae bacterium]